MTKSVCRHCNYFDADPSVNFCMCSPYPSPIEYFCRNADFAGCDSPDLVNCPDCIYALQSRFCVRGHSGGGQSDCPHYQSCFI